MLQDAVRRVGDLRASRHLHAWGKLTRMIEARSKEVLAKICCEWYDVVLLTKACCMLLHAFTLHLALHVPGIALNPSLF